MEIISNVFQAQFLWQEVVPGISESNVSKRGSIESKLSVIMLFFLNQVPL